MVWYAIAIGRAASVSAPDSGPTMNCAWSDRMHLRAISSDSDAEDWLFITM